MTTCLITGAAGFVASHLISYLLKETDWTIVGWDKMTYAAENGRRLVAIGASKNPRFSLRKLDIAAGGFPAQVNPDFIIHLGAETHVERSVQNPDNFMMSNVFGTYSMLEYAQKQSQLKKFLMFSTDEVFGPAEEVPFHEWSRHNPSNPYAATKSAAENLSMAWANTYAVPVIVTHCSNVIGTMQNSEKFLPKLVHLISQGKKVKIHADKEGRVGSRMYVHADDVAKAIVMLLAGGETGEKYNIPGLEVSNFDMACKVADILGKKLVYEKVYPQTERPGWDFSYRIAGEKIQKLGWTPSPDFDALLREVVEYTVENLSLSTSL